MTDEEEYQFLDGKEQILPWIRSGITPGWFR
jgi:hypothetical protein